MLALVLAAGIAAAGPDPDADGEGARRFAELIDEAANRGEFDSALVLTDEAERLYPHHRWKFFRASIFRAMDRCEEAIPQYEGYIKAEKVDANVASATEGLEDCRKRTEPEPPPPEPVEPVPEPTPPPPRVDDTPSASPRAKWARDPAGIALLASGLAVLGGGAVIYLQGADQRDKAESGADLDDFETKLRRARILGGVGVATIIVGGALAIGGAVRFAVVAKRHKRAVAFNPFAFQF